MPLFECATFGNKEGSHQLLSTTVAAGASVLDHLRFLVDRPAGHVDSSVTWSPYWGCQPVDAWWVLWRGEEDLDAPRRNMVKVKVALLPVAQCALLDDLDELLASVGHAGDDRSSDDALQLAGTVVQRLSATGTPIMLPGIGWAPRLLRALWPRLWPSARASLSLRTVFGPESLNTVSPPKIFIFPVELTPRWRGHPILEGSLPVAGPASRWFGGDASPQVERLLKANTEQLPGEFSVLVRVDRIVERLERLHRGEGTVSDALVVVRTQEAFPSGFKLPPEDLEVISNALTNLGEASPGDIRMASLTRLDQVTNQGEVEAALTAWVQARLPEAEDQDALWVLQHHLSQEHAPWWRSGVSRGLAAAFKQRRPEWARALWNWWTRLPSAIEWTARYLDGSAAVEGWLANHTPKEIHGDLLKMILEVCRKHNWATLLARTLGSGRPLVECIGTMREVLRSPEEGIKALLSGRADKEIIAAAGATNWPPLIVRATEITRAQPTLFECVRGAPGLIPLLVAHLKGGGEFPSDLVSPDFLGRVFDGVLKGDQQLEDVAGFLRDSAGASALDHPRADQLLCRVNADVVSGAVAEWWTRFLNDDGVGAPPTSVQSAVIASARVRCEGKSATLIVRLLQLLPGVSEEVFVEWMMHTRFLWGVGVHQQVASLLVERDWRSAAKSFRHSWKRELKVVAWYARDILSWSDSFWWPPAEVDSFADTDPISSTKKATRRTMKITFMASNPVPSSRLALDEEARLIEEKVRDAKHRDMVTFRTRWAVRPEDLQQALLEDEPVVVHFSGHGGGAVGIVLHSQDQSDERLVAEDALADLFRVLKDNIRVVVLNACYSEVQAKAIVKEIDFVVGMSDSVGDEAARMFAAAFYRGLAFGRSVQNAFDLGLNELRLVGLGHEDHIPQLLVRTGVDPSKTVLVGGG
jgi:GTPase-associated protein 1, N-terminal domain type 1/CHAT domain